MRAPSRDICAMLEAESELSLVYGQNLFNHGRSDLPTIPDQCVVVYDPGGFDPFLPSSAAGGTAVYDRPVVQISVRGNKGRYNETHALAKAIHNAFRGLGNVTIPESARYIGIWSQGDVIDAGNDENKRPICTVNVRIHRTDL